MSYCTLMVLLNDKDQATALLQVAIIMARQHSAYLKGVYVKPPIQLYANAKGAVYPSVDHHALHDKQSKQLEKLFKDMTEKEDIVTEWRCITDATISTPDVVTKLARTVDLLIVGQKNPDEENLSVREVTERILMTANRPVVVVPRGQEFQTVGSKVIVAWDGGSSATRAVFDSLPVLKNAESVTLYRINPTSGDSHKSAGSPTEMINTIGRHKIKAEFVESDAISAQLGDELLAYTTEQGADLLVMGAYGHSQIRELIFGGVTRFALDNLSIPVLMSH